jgi:hypothetical protein
MDTSSDKKKLQLLQHYERTLLFNRAESTSSDKKKLQLLQHYERTLLFNRAEYKLQQEKQNITIWDRGLLTLLTNHALFRSFTHVAEDKFLDMVLKKKVEISPLILPKKKRFFSFLKYNTQIFSYWEPFFSYFLSVLG